MRAVDPDLPVLVLTAWTSLETAVQMVKEGASDYLAKPWDDAKLLAAVRNLLRAARAAAGTPVSRPRGRGAARRARGSLRPARARRTRARRCTAWSPWRCRWPRADVPVLDHRARAAWARRSSRRSSRPTRAASDKAFRQGQRRRPARRAAGERAVRRRGRRLHGSDSAASAASRPPTAARCSWTRSATSRPPARPSSCASSRAASSSGSDRARRAGWTCA